jgi:hypothetical protein
MTISVGHANFTGGETMSGNSDVNSTVYPTPVQAAK